MAEIKFCGLTRPEDASLAASLGAAYLGVIFAGGPRLRTAEQAREIFAGANGSLVRRVGVFGAQPVDEILRIADTAALDVLQLHDGGTAERVATLRQRFGGVCWRVERVPTDATAAVIADQWRAASVGVEAVVLDALVAGRLGGTGVRLDWSAIAAGVPSATRIARLVLAGGLTADNVAEAVRTVRPAVVDVSSGVESAPGIKDESKLRAFALAVRGTTD